LRKGSLLCCPGGGARNAINCAPSNFGVKKSGQSVFELIGISLSPVSTVITVTIDTPEEMAGKARAVNPRQIKVKLNGELPLERIAAVCQARLDADGVAAANQGWSGDLA
jgi:L-alanine-DL-glutamate epimerase-like enolase superfamily enzyme